MENSRTREKARFHTTRWSVVIAAARHPSLESAEALARLCEAYWLPVYAFVRRRGYPADDAADLTQEFFARMLDRGYLVQARPDRGRFRSFVLAAVTHFLANEWDRRRTRKRGGEAVVVPIDKAVAEEGLAYELADHTTPEHTFEKRWALALLDSTLLKLRAECAARGRVRLFDRLKPTLSGERSDASYGQIAREFGMSEEAVKVVVHRLRRRFGAILRDEVAQTVQTADDVESELRYLLSVVSAK